MTATTPIKVLLIEDDPLMSRMYQRVFAFEGFEMQLAENGQAGLAKLADFRPDIIVLDVMMPIMDGKTTLAKIKADPAIQNIPVIMLTNLDDPQSAEESLSKGATSYLLKSKEGPAEVASRIRAILREQPPK